MQSLLRTRAGEPRRPDGPGRARPAGADPGEGGAPVHRAPATGCGRTRPSCCRSTTSCCASRSRDTLGVVVFQDQVLEVAMALAGFTVGEAEGLRRAMSRKRSSRRSRRTASASSTGARGNGVDEQTARPRLRQARRLLRLRLPEVARGRVRPARLPVGVAAPPLPGRVPLRAAERAADGLLSAGEPRPRRAAARGGGAAARREPERCEVQRSSDGACAIGLGYVGGRRGRGGGGRRRPGAGRTPTSATSRGARPSTRARSRRSSPRGACDRVRAAAAAALAARRVTRPQASAGAAATASSRCRSSRPPRRRSCPSRPRGRRCSPTTGTRSLSVGVHPLQLLRPHLGREVCSSTELLEAPHGATVSVAGHGDRAAAARRRRTGSSSCCSRTSTARST